MPSSVCEIKQNNYFHVKMGLMVQHHSIHEGVRRSSLMSTGWTVSAHCMLPHDICKCFVLS